MALLLKIPNGTALGFISEGNDILHVKALNSVRSVEYTFPLLSCQVAVLL